MELGEKIRLARLEAGLSQRQLCGDVITRNMLSLIEHGAARPSMETLKYLSQRLGKSVSFFLEENAVLSPNQQVMEQARRQFDLGDYEDAARSLEGYRGPDPVYDRERGLLEGLVNLALAEQAIGEQRFPYALELLARVGEETAYCREALQRRRLLLLGRIPGQRVSHLLPSLDEELCLRAEEALAAGDLQRAEHLLESVQDRTGEGWNLLRGKILMEQKAFREAASCLHRAENSHWEAIPLLERCCRELGDFKQAYEYACKQKK